MCTPECYCVCVNVCVCAPHEIQYHQPQPWGNNTSPLLTALIDPSIICVDNYSAVWSGNGAKTAARGRKSRQDWWELWLFGVAVIKCDEESVQLQLLWISRQRLRWWRRQQQREQGDGQHLFTHTSLQLITEKLTNKSGSATRVRVHARLT